MDTYFWLQNIVAMVDPQYFWKTGGYPQKKCPKGHPHFFISPKKQGVLKNHPQFSITALILFGDFIKENDWLHTIKYESKK